MIFARQHADGSLTDIQNLDAARTWADGSVDVQLVAMPSGFGPWSYDAVNKLAVTSASLLTADQRAAAVAILTDPDASPKALRGLGLVLLDYADRIGTQHNAVLTWLGTQTTLINRGQLTGFALPTTLALSDLKTAITNHVNAGDAD